VQQVRRGHLGRRIERGQVPGESAYYAQPFAQVGRMRLLPGSLGPCDGEFGGDRRGTGGLEVADEAVQHPRVVLELEAERAAQRDVVVHRPVQRAHAEAPGQGRARGRSAMRSTLA